MTLGPVELVVLGFPGSRFSGEIRPRIQDLVDRNIVNIVDALLITKSDQGEVTYFEMDEIQDVDPDLRALHACFSEELDLISEEDGEVFAAELAPGSSALAIAFEHTWMRPVRDAVVNSGGVLIADVQIPAQVVDEVLDAVGQRQVAEQRLKGIPMPFRRAGRPGLIGTMARTAVVAGTASAVVNRGNQRRDARQQATNEDQQSQQQMADMQAQLDQANAEKQAAAQQAAIDKAVNDRMAQQSAAVPAQAASADDTMAKLQKLADMKSQGLLSDQEFAAMKGKLLGI